MSRKGRKDESHVRLYRHEVESPAYRSLNTNARALLVEMRALYRGVENRVHMSRREIEKRLGIGRCKAEGARDQLLDRGFIKLIEPASFNRKVRHAPTYALTNEPLNPNQDGATPTKDFMHWQPSKKFSTGPVTNPGGAGDQPRTGSRTAKNSSHRVSDQPRDSRFEGNHGVGDQPTDKLPGCTSVNGGFKPIDAALEVCDVEVQFRLCWAAVLLSIPRDTLQ